MQNSPHIASATGSAFVRAAGTADAPGPLGGVGRPAAPPGPFKGLTTLAEPPGGPDETAAEVLPAAALAPAVAFPDVFVDTAMPFGPAVADELADAALPGAGEGDAGDLPGAGLEPGAGDAVGLLSSGGGSSSPSGMSSGGGSSSPSGFGGSCRIRPNG